MSYVLRRPKIMRVAAVYASDARINSSECDGAAMIRIVDSLSFTFNKN
jgi:hypothetical protein